VEEYTAIPSDHAFAISYIYNDIHL
jgi:hypothetical protein